MTELCIVFIAGMLLGAVGCAIIGNIIQKLFANPRIKMLWHNYNETPENRSYVLAYLDGKYVVLFYRDALYEFPPYYESNWAGTTRVDRWMYIPGNLKRDKEVTV